MHRAIGIRCGRAKRVPWHKCSSCGFDPTNDPEALRDFSEHTATVFPHGAVRRWRSYSIEFGDLSQRRSNVIGDHASERLEERGIMEWQAAAGLEDGEMIAERPDASPNPIVEVRECLPDGTEFKAVWSYLRTSGVAKLVTVHFFDRV
jgi:hypothetical protein